MRVPRWLRRVAGMPGATPFTRFGALAERAGALADEFSALDDAELRDAASAAARAAFSATPTRAPGGEGRTPASESSPVPLGSDDATVRFLAAAREAADRSTGLRPFEVQLQACGALLAGNAVEMDTGEGKTLVGALAAAGYGLAGRHAHVLSVNDYLAERDAAWMRPLFDLLGLEVSWIGQRTARDERREAYRADIVYAPVSEVGFDVLRDRFVVNADEAVSPALEVAIVDEADAVMIDEAMVPLVLAGTSVHEAEPLDEATRLASRLVEGDDFEVDAERVNAWLTDVGIERLEHALGGLNIFEPENAHLLTQVNLALHARVLVRRDVDYLVADGSIRLINAARGRVAHLQRWPDGLHAAVEAKEGLPPSPRSVVLDS
ncbi:MAG: DEAD/DEAH box helicase, partial [Pseudoclavibacter sp.]